ncbi:MAG: PAC2 family protein [Actinobacteria bacterium]|jgi:proteasome assembly chaperone (PAC2) family protein|nr:PAC2 family protein [Actinomycetota bacterium]NDA38469.1 PAC2 family protein [Actinomycetota bacterium]NDE12205.1 PAC2 family protein [Actinomycetota bacterium]NDE83226.1 PAC2 family protein [Actinomycetota bacterium]
MHLFESAFPLRQPIMLAAFEGWNDAGESATGAINHLLASWTHHKLAMMNPEDYYDFQVNRPSIKVDERVVREIIWPNTVVFEVSTPHLKNDFLVVKGIEPSMKWRTFANELLDLADDYEVSMSITLGALLSDTPHTRPITVTGSGAHPDVANRLGIEISKYEGPTGIIGVLQDSAHQRGIDAVSLWASVPHYVSTPPCPKASLALINSLEDFLDISIPQGDLPERSTSWESQVDQMAAEDSEVGDYVKQLESSKDAADIPAATGESIAREVERFLRRHPGV